MFIKFSHNILPIKFSHKTVAIQYKVWWKVTVLFNREGSIKITKQGQLFMKKSLFYFIVKGALKSQDKDNYSWRSHCFISSWREHYNHKTRTTINEEVTVLFHREGRIKITRQGQLFMKKSLFYFIVKGALKSQDKDNYSWRSHCFISSWRANQVTSQCPSRTTLCEKVTFIFQWWGANY